MKFTSFDRNNLDQAKSLIQDKLNELAELGLIIKMGGISFSSQEFSVSLTVMTGLKDGESAEQKEWNDNCRKFGLTPEQFGTTFYSNGKELVVCGIKKYADYNGYPVLAKDTKTDKMYKFPSRFVTK